jgi:hypothetical protein
MRYRTAFRLALKAIGLWVAITYALRLALVLLQSVWGILKTPGFHFSLAGELPNLLGVASGVALGLYLLSCPEWIINQAIPSDRTYCHACGYERHGVGLDAPCPECGATAPVQIDAGDRAVCRESRDATGGEA